MARNRAVTRRGFHHKKAGITIPLAVVAGFIPLGIELSNSYKSGGIAMVGDHAIQALSGYNINTGRFNMGTLRYGTMPIAAGFLVHWLIGGKLGVNRMLQRAGIPLVRI